MILTVVWVFVGDRGHAGPKYVAIERGVGCGIRAHQPFAVMRWNHASLGD